MKSYIKTLFTPTALQQLAKVGLIGVVNTIVSFTLFNVLLSVLGGVKTVDEGFNWGQFWSVALSFIIATFVSYLLNRRWAFALREPGDARRETAHFFAINLVAWAITQASVSGADVLFGPLNRLEGNLAYLAAALVIIVPKFAGYRDIVFRKAIDQQAQREELPTT
jgi:putative flippase GtrA